MSLEDDPLAEAQRSRSRALGEPGTPGAGVLFLDARGCTGTVGVEVIADASFAPEGTVIGDECGLSLSDFASKFTSAINHAGKSLGVTVAQTIKGAGAKAKALPAVVRALPPKLVTQPWTVATMPLRLAQAPLHDGLRKAGLTVVSDLIRSPERLAENFASASAYAASLLLRGDASGSARALQAGLRELRANPAFKGSIGALSLVPVAGTTVATGITIASAVGAGMRSDDIALEAARAALPGGMLAQVAFDVGVGLSRGESLSEAGLFALREQLPPSTRVAFDTGLMIARRRGVTPTMVQMVRSQYGDTDRAAYDAAWTAALKAKP